MSVLLTYKVENMVLNYVRITHTCLCVHVHIYSKSGINYFPVIVQVYQSFILEK